MSKTAISIIEEIYNMPLNPELDYYAQLEPLAANGELANHNSSLKVLFKICVLLDEQVKRIRALEEELRKNAKPVQTPIDPTQPLDDTTTNQTKHDAS